MNRPERIPLYLTDEHKCSYLDTEMARTAFIDPNLKISTPVYSSLNQQGFRRSGDFLYRPHCEACQRCKSLRIPLSQFKPNRSQRRNQKKNNDITVVVKTNPDIWDYYDLYERYLKSRHADGDMYPPDPAQYESFLGFNGEYVRHVEYRLEDKLIMVSVMDELSESLSAAYTFFDPEHSDRGLGNFAILWQISHAKEKNLAYLYLGFWIAESEKMKYKSHYQPHEIFQNGKWQAPQSQQNGGDC